MARQKSIIKLEGNIGDINFYRSKNGYLARETTTLTAQRIATDPKFKRTRENNAEFKNAATAAKILRKACSELLQYSKDGSAHNRLFKEMMKVVKADVTSTRGKRNVMDGETELLQDFEFNSNATLNTTLFAPYSKDINRVTGVLKAEIPSFVPEDLLLAPVTSTHFRFVCLGTEVDFEQQSWVTQVQQSGVYPWNITPTGDISLEAQLPANSTHPLFLLFGLQFFQEVNGQRYPLKDGTFNSLSIIKVSGV
jgi:hypothetical protein